MPVRSSATLALLLALFSTAALTVNHSTPNQGVIFVELEPRLVQQSIELLFSNHGYSIQHSTHRSLGAYFDTPELKLLKSSAYLKFNAIEDPATNKTKLDEEVIYYTDALEGFQVDVKHYNSSKTLLGKHPLFGVIKRKQRPALLLRLKDDGFLTPLRFKEVAKVAKITHIYTLSLGQSSIASITLNEIESVIFGQEVSFNTLSATSSMQNDEFNALYASLFSSLGVNGTKILSNEYSALHNQINKHIPYFNWLLKYPFINRLLSSFTVGAFGAFSIYLVFQWRNRKRLT